MTAVLLDKPTDAQWRRLSPRMLLIHPVVEIARAIPALAGVVLAGSSRGHGGLWGLIGTGVVAAFSLTRWFTTRFRVGAEQVQLRHGLIRRRTIATRRERIRTVDVTSHLLHRVFGLARVVVGTGTSDRKGEGRLVLDGLTLPEAAALRDELLHRTPVAQRSDAPVSEIARLDPRWIRFAPFTLSGVVTGFVIYGFLWRIQGESGVDLMHSGPLRAVTHDLGQLPRAVAVLTVVAAAVVFVAVTSTVGYVLAFWHFRVVRHDGGTLQVTRGLVTTRATSIERRRLVGAEVSESLLLRAVGGARALAVATGLRVGRGAERGGEVLLPPAPRAEAERVAALVLDGTPAVTAPLRGHGPRAARRRLLRAVGGAAVLLGAASTAWAAGAPAWLPAVGVALVVLAVPVGLDRARSLGHALADGYLVARLGSIVRRRTILAADAVIGWNMRTTYFQRRAGLATLIATTAAGRQGCAVDDLPAGQVLELVEAVTPGLVSQFRAAPRATSR